MPAKMKATQQKQPTFEETIERAEEWERANRPIYDMLAKIHERQEAEHAAVLKLQNKNEIKKSDLVRIFDDHAKAIEEILKALDCSIYFAILWSEHPNATRLPDDPPEEDDGSAPKTAIAYELKKHGKWREHIEQHLRAIRAQLFKL